MNKFYNKVFVSPKIENVHNHFFLILLLYQSSFFFFDFISHNYIHYVGPYERLGFSTWEPMAGLSIGLVYFFEKRFIPFLFICPIISEIIFSNEDINLLILLQSELFSAICYLAIAYLLKNAVDFEPSFRRAQDMVLFGLVSSALSLVNTAEYMGILYLTGYLTTDKLFPSTWRFFVGELSGILSIGPLTLLFFYHNPWKILPILNILQLALLSLFLLIIFVYPEATVFQLFYLLFLPAVWIALTSGPPFAALSLLFVQALSILGSELRFGSDTGRGSVQAMVIALALTILIVSAVVAENEDNSKRLRDQEIALNRAMRIKTSGETAATIAHEINQPLTALSTYVDVALNAITVGDKILLENILTQIKRQSERLSAIIKSIRALLKKENVIFSTIYAKDICKDVLDVIKDECKRSNSNLSIDMSANDTKIYGDIFQIQQAVINLVSNSNEALLGAKKQGHITIRIFNISHKECAIEVEDDGPGFPPYFNIKERLPFMSEKTEGTGMGLSIVQSIVELHGGLLEIDFKTNGALVRIKLPIMI